MPVKIPQSLRTMLEDKAYGHVMTFNTLGKPELTMVWMDVEGDELLFNTSGRCIISGGPYSNSMRS